MLDVHSPHGAAHSWKDFWIHLGTISLGLPIAIGLEQGVETIHRLQERHRLFLDTSDRIPNSRRRPMARSCSDLRGKSIDSHRLSGKLSLSNALRKDGPRRRRTRHRNSVSLRESQA